MKRLSFTVLLNLLMDNIPDKNGDKYSLAELSRETGISVNQLGHYRRGTHSNPTLENVIVLLDLFEMPLAYLDCTHKVEAMKMLTARHPQGDVADEASELPSVRFRNPEGLNVSDKALYQVTELLQWVFAREEALKKGEAEPPLPDFSQE